MADVEIYDYCRGSGPAAGMQLERAMALHGDTQRELDRVAGSIQRDARANLARGQDSPEWRYSQGHTKVLPVESGDIDRFVVLSDERGLWAAWMVEMGGPAGKERRPQAGKHILTAAALGAYFRLGGL